MTVAPVTAVGAAGIFVDDSIPTGYPKPLCLTIPGTFVGIYCVQCVTLWGSEKMNTGVDDPMANGHTEGVDHRMARVLSMVINRRQKD